MVDGDDNAQKNLCNIRYIPLVLNSEYSMATVGLESLQSAGREPSSIKEDTTDFSNYRIDSILNVRRSPEGKIIGSDYSATDGDTETIESLLIKSLRQEMRDRSGVRPMGSRDPMAVYERVRAIYDIKGEISAFVKSTGAPDGNTSLSLYVLAFYVPR